MKGEAGEGEISTEQVINDLTSQCRAYCDSPDPYVTLNIGTVLTFCNADICGKSSLISSVMQFKGAFRKQ